MCKRVRKSLKGQGIDREHFETFETFERLAFGTKGRRAILTSIGVALLGTSVFGGGFPSCSRNS